MRLMSPEKIALGYRLAASFINSSKRTTFARPEFDDMYTNGMWFQQVCATQLMPHWIYCTSDFEHGAWSHVGVMSKIDLHQHLPCWHNLMVVLTTG